MMKYWIIFWFSFGVLQLQAQPLALIQGKVIDPQNQEAVVGATVSAKGTSWGTMTNDQGFFELRLPAGVYSLELRYFGYETLELPSMELKEGQQQYLDLALPNKKSHGLEEVVITASRRRESIAALYLQQRQETSVSSGISSEQIQKSGDRNTAEVLKRVSGASIRDNQYVVVRGLSERYNLALVNESLMANTEPDRKSFSFELIPSHLIDQVLVSKTARADLPGDFAGGLVRVFTRDIPSTSFHSLGISLSQHSQSWGAQTRFSPRPAGAVLGFPGKTRALPASFGSGYMDYRSSPGEAQWKAARELENPYIPQKGRVHPNGQIQHSLGRVKRWKNGGELGWVTGANLGQSTVVIPRFVRARYETERVGSFYEDYTTRMQSQASAMANITYVQPGHRFSFKNFYYKNFQETFYERHGFTTSNNQEIMSFSAVPWERQVVQSQMEGRHAIPWKRVDWSWNLSYMQLRARQDDLRTVFYSRNLNFDDQDRPQYQREIPFQIVDRNSRRFFSGQKDHSFGAQTALAAGGDSARISWKIGYSIQHRSRRFGARIFQYGFSGAAFADGMVSLPVDRIFEADNLGPEGFGLEEITNPTDAYQASALSQSAYLMSDWALSDKWSLNLGLRGESYRQRLISQDLTGKDIHQEDLFLDWLPSANLSYESGEKSQWRLSGSRTINRPEFREIAPFTFLDLENLWTVNGNPALKRSRIINLDFRYEYYFSPGEIWMAGMFYKRFQDPIEKVMDDQSNLDLFVFGYQNAPWAESIGWEVDLRKNLDFVAPSPWLKNLYLGANLTYVVSRVSLPSGNGESATRPMEGQSPYLINLSLSYEDPEKGWGTGFLYHRIGHRMVIVGNHTIPATWEQGRDLLDFQLRRQIAQGKAELKLTISDLFNQPHILYWNANQRNSLQKGHELMEEGKDRIIQEYRLGTGFSLGFSYHF